MRKRSDAAAGPVGGRSETFEYDDFERLEQWTIDLENLPTTAPSTGYAYDEIGNLTEIYDLVDGTLQTANYYDGPRPHALELSDVVGVGQDDFEYDDRGRQYIGGGRDDVAYAGFDLPTSVTTAVGTTVFAYDAHRSRVRKQAPDGTVTTSIGGLYERRGTGAGAYQHVFRVMGGEGPVAELAYDEADAASGVSMRFIVTDMLGSVSLVTDEAGNVDERLFYDPFGQRIGVGGAPVASATTTQHGFTDHWHDDELGLINMRGRVYDPRSRRFLTPDPVVSDPLFGQSYNRYSYVLNDPINLIDPTGFEHEPPRQAPGPPGGVSTGCGDCSGLLGGDDGIKPPLQRSDSQTWQDMGCPEARADRGNGPCPEGQVGGGCGGAIFRGYPFGRTLPWVFAPSAGGPGTTDPFGLGYNGSWSVDKSRLTRDGLPIVDGGRRDLGRDLTIALGADVESAPGGQVSSPRTLALYSLATDGLLFVIAVATPGSHDDLALLGKAAAREINPLAGSIRRVNPTGATKNCVSCAIATDATLGGSPASAIPGGPFDAVSSITTYKPGAIGIPANGPDGIRKIMANWGPGSRGIVWGTRAGRAGHTFNVVNQGGTIRFIDGQIGRGAVETGFESYYIFRTH